MNKEFYGVFDQVKAPDPAVEKAIEAAASVDPSAQIIEMKSNRRRKRWISVTAAVLVVAVILGITLIPRSGNPDTKGSRFTITANAAAVGDKYGSNTVGVFRGSSPFSMDEISDDKTGEYYMAFMVDYLHIEGEDIASVSMRTDVKEFLFVIDPSPPMDDGADLSGLAAGDDWEKTLIADEDKFARAREKEKSKYTDLSMIDSDKTEDELRTEFNGAICCNSFTYQNTDRYDTIKFDGYMMMWMKLTKSDDEMTKLLEESDAISKERDKERYKLYQDVAEDFTDEKWDALQKAEKEFNQRAAKLTEKILRHVFKDGVITVEVTFTDGTTESKTLTLGAAIMEDEIGTPLLIISEAS